MPATVGDRTATRHSAPSGSRTATLTLARFLLRQDRVKLPAWIVGLGLLVVYIGAALPELAPSEQDLAAAVPLLEQPVGRMFAGPAFGLDAPTYERFFAAGYLLYLFLLAALMNIMLVVRHTRLEEQTGRAELIRANVVGRDAPLTAALLVAVLADIAAAIVVTALAVGNGFALTGSLLVGAATGATGLAFAGVTAVTVQLSESSRTAAGWAGVVVGVAFALRGLGDMAEVGGSALSWTSPFGWASQTAPYVHDRWWPLLLLLGLGIVGALLGFVLQNKRDLGAGLISARRGAAMASRFLGTPLGLAWRLQRGGLAGWAASIVALGCVDGAFADVIVESAADLPEAVRQMFGAEQLLTGYLAFLAIFGGYLTAAYVVFAAQVLRAEETSGRAGALLATPVSRSAWAGSHLLVIGFGAAVILLLTGVGTGAAVAGSLGDWQTFGDVVASHLNMIPAVLLVLGLCAALYGWVPGWLPAIGWAVVALAVFVGNFADLLDLPEWVRALSPLSHPADMPVESFDVLPALWLAVLALAGAGIGLAGLRQRQIGVR